MNPVRSTVAMSVVGASEFGRVVYLDVENAVPTPSPLNKLVFRHAVVGGVSQLLVNGPLLSGGPYNLLDDDRRVDHASVDVSGGTGLNGGGDLTASRTLELDIDSLTEDVLDPVTDFVPFFHTGTASTRKFDFGSLASNAFTVQNDGVDVDTVTSQIDVRGDAFAAVGLGGGNVAIGSVFGDFSQIEESLGATISNSTAFATKVTMNTPVLPAGNYSLKAAYTIQLPIRTERWEVRVLLDGTTVFLLQRQEMKDVQNVLNKTCLIRGSLGAGARTFELQFRKQNGTTNLTISNARLFFRREFDGL